MKKTAEEIENDICIIINGGSIPEVMSHKIRLYFASQSDARDKEIIEKQNEFIHHLKHIITELYGSCNDSLTNKFEQALQTLKNK